MNDPTSLFLARAAVILVLGARAAAVVAAGDPATLVREAYRIEQEHLAGNRPSERKAPWTPPRRAKAMATALPAAARPSAVTLGVVNWSAAPAPQVRLAFRTVEGGWEALPDPAPDRESLHKYADLPRTMHWTVCFDGKTRGTLDTELTPSESYALAGVHVQLPAPFPSERSADSGEWTAPPAHPLMAVSSAGLCADPDGWHRKTLPPAAKKALFRAVHESVKVQGCDEKGNWNVWRYPDGQIDIVKTYVSRQGEWLAMLRVLGPPRSNASACDVVLGEEHDVQLFHLDATGKAKHLGASLTVVDAGDYDGDGKSEVLTVFQRDNYDGYTLLYDRFRRQVSFGWHYH